MLIDSARELKERVLRDLTATVATASAVRSMGIRTQASQPGKDSMRSIAIGISLKGKQHCLAVRVQRRAMESHPIIEQMRKSSKGEIDVRYVGRIQKLESPATLQKRRRPMAIGCSIGHHKITAGTLGCFVVDRATGEILVLSNNHVLANENDAVAGDAILQPGKFDGGTLAKSNVGKLKAFVKLRKTGTNFVDCAVSSIKTGVKHRKHVLGSFGKLIGLGTEFVPEGTKVHKVGRTTGETTGSVTAFEIDNVVVGYDIGNLRFDNQIEIEGTGNDPFSDGGDSGSLIFNENLEAIAILFAGGDSGGSNGMGLTYANPIRTVLDSLRVDLEI